MEVDIRNMGLKVKDIAFDLKNVTLGLLDERYYDVLKQKQVRLLKDVVNLDYIGNMLVKGTDEDEK